MVHRMIILYPIAEEQPHTKWLQPPAAASHRTPSDGGPSVKYVSLLLERYVVGIFGGVVVQHDLVPRVTDHGEVGQRDRVCWRMLLT
jgi:hypothetical protein